ncbi:MAG: hypothetical protein DRJ14_04785, partial [Acidobacteria bacterium]
MGITIDSSILLSGIFSLLTGNSPTLYLIQPRFRRKKSDRNFATRHASDYSIVRTTVFSAAVFLYL